MGFFAKAACLALKDMPAVNAQIEGDEIVYHDYVDISVAVSRAQRPRRAGGARCRRSCRFAEIEKAIADYGKKAKDGTLTMDDMKGGTFTISNGGVFGCADVAPRSSTRRSARCSASTASRTARSSATARS